MNFEQLYQKVKNNEATEEEKAYVEKVIFDANAYFVKEDNVITVTNDDNLFKAFKNKVNKKIVKRSIIISLISIISIMIITLALFISLAFIPAKNNINYSKTEAQNKIVEYISSNDEIYGKFINISEFEKDFCLEFPSVKSSYIQYEITVYTTLYELEFEFNSKTGTFTSKID